MKDFCIYDIGFSYCLTFFATISSVSEIEKEIIKNRSSAFIVNSWYDLPFDSGEITIFLYRTTHKKAYDLKYKYNGKYINPVNAEVIRSMLNAVGAFPQSIHEPIIYNLNCNIIRKE